MYRPKNPFNVPFILLESNVRKSTGKKYCKVPGDRGEDPGFFPVIRGNRKHGERCIEHYRHGKRGNMSYKTGH